MKQQIIIQSVDAVPEAAEQFIIMNKGIKKFAFYAEMGFGKTTLIKAICSCLGFIDTVTSPTYGIVNEYPTKNDYIYHIDLYRLNNIEEALDIGIENYLFDDAYCFIEWPGLIEPFLPETFKKINIKLDASNNRIIYF